LVSLTYRKNISSKRKKFPSKAPKYTRLARRNLKNTILETFDTKLRGLQENNWKLSFRSVVQKEPNKDDKAMHKGNTWQRV